MVGPPAGGRAQKPLKKSGEVPIRLRMEKVKAGVAAPGSSSSMGLVPPRPTPVSDAPAGGWNAPVVAPARLEAPTGPFDPTVLLDVLVDEVDGVRGVILASVDGFGIGRSTSMADEPSHPAMLAAAVGLAHQLVSLGGGTKLRQLVVDHDGGLLLVWPIGAQRVLAVLAATTVEQRRVRAFVHSQVSILTEVSGESA